MMDDTGQSMPETTYDPELQRKKVALALQMQGKMGKPHPWGQMANTALQVWNLHRQMPKPTVPLSDTAISQVEANPLGK
jgi:hypothetical protein